MVHLQTTYELCFVEAYFEYFESCDFPAKIAVGLDQSIIDQVRIVMSRPH
jgi:hypothetical protein